MRLAPLLLVTLQMVLASAALAQGNSPPAAAASGGVTGTVYDSLAGTPLQGALVQLVAASDAAASARTVTSDALGRYMLAGVPSGRYVIGFLRPVLDAIGISVPVRAVVIERALVRVDLAVPSPPGLSAALCPGAAPGDSIAALAGFVRDAVDRTAVAGAVVAAEWLELSLGVGGMRRGVARREARTLASGWFALCDVPRGGALQLLATRGPDSTSAVEVEVPSSGFTRHDLFLGAATSAPATRPSQPDGPAGPLLRTGEGRLQGVVLNADGGNPVGGARVTVPRGAATISNERGEWALSGLPMGTQTLDVRAVGFYPERASVEVIADAPLVTTTLRTMQAVLDTVRVVASRNRLRATGFDDRRRSGMGRYLTADDVGRRLAITTSDLFRTIPGVQVDRQAVDETLLTVSGPFGRCQPTVFIDGMMMQRLSADDIDAFVDPRNISGIEIYTGAMVPPQFQAGLTGCGSLVIWTGPGDNSDTSGWGVEARGAQRRRDAARIRPRGPAHPVMIRPDFEAACEAAHEAQQPAG